MHAYIKLLSQDASCKALTVFSSIMSSINFLGKDKAEMLYIHICLGGLEQILGTVAGV